MHIKKIVTLLFTLLISAGVSLTVACSQTDNYTGTNNNTATKEISIQEATNVLNQTVEYAINHNLDGLCSMGGAVSMCRTLWEYAGEWDAVPTQSPEINDTYLLPEKDLGNGTYTVGGRILVLEGIDGLGKPYKTEFLVFNNSETGELSALYPVYWANLSIGEYDSTGNGLTPLSQTQ